MHKRPVYVRKALTLVIVLATLACFAPFFSPLVMASIFAAILWPVMQLWDGRFKRRSLGAALITLAFGIGILLPAAGALFSAVRTGQALLQPPAAESPIPASGDSKGAEAPAPTPSPDFAVREGNGKETKESDGSIAVAGASAAARVQAKLQSLWAWVGARLPIDPEKFQDMISQATSAIGGKAAMIFAAILGMVPAFLVAFVLTLVSLFFFLLDGARVVAVIRKNPWFTRAETDRLIMRAGTMARSGVLASIASGAGQATIFAVAAVIAGMSNVFLLAVLIFLGSFIPVVGSAPVAIGTVIYQFIKVGPVAGVVFIAVAIVVGTVDNFIRPAFLKGSSDIHPLLAMLSALGGLAVFGFTGVFLGPILVVLAMEVMSFKSSD